MLTSRVSEHEPQNRMSARNLASIFGPTLLGSEDTSSEDAKRKIRVVETIITFALDMFELGIA